MKTDFLQPDKMGPEFFFFVISFFKYLQIPRNDIVINWLVQHPTDQYTHQKVQESTFICACVFLSVPSTRIFCALIYKLLPFRNSYPGSHGTQSSPFPTTVRAFVLIARKKCCRIKFPSLASPCVKYRMISVSRYPEHIIDIDIDISRI